MPTIYRRRRWPLAILVLVCVLACLPSRAPADVFEPKTDPVFQKMLAIDRNLRTYQAHITVEAHVMLATFTLRGTIYYKNGRSKVIFDNVPSIAKSIVQNQPTLPAASTWLGKYDVSVATRDTDTTRYHLVPIGDSPLKSVEALARNETGLVQQFVWEYTNGGIVTSDQTFETVDGYQVVHASDTTTRGRGLHTNSHSTFTDYQFNVDVPDSVFAQ